MNSKITISDFSPHLFWDVDMSKFNWDLYKSFLIFKVLDDGSWNDWKLIQQKYGNDEIKIISVQLENLDIVTVRFLATFFKIEITNFKSYHPLLTSKRFRKKIQNQANFEFL